MKFVELSCLGEFNVDNPRAVGSLNGDGRGHVERLTLSEDRKVGVRKRIAKPRPSNLRRLTAELKWPLTKRRKMCNSCKRCKHLLLDLVCSVG